MNIKLSPSSLSGSVAAVPSKSVSHRSLICAALCKGTSIVRNLAFSKDITATVDSLTAMGAEIFCSGDTAVVKGIRTPNEVAMIPCNESGSTLRFLIPIASAFGIAAIFTGEGKLPNRPITPYLEALPPHGVEFDYDGTMPFSIGGQLTGGEFTLDGNVSSQFVSGLLFALPLHPQDSRIHIRGKLESKPYVTLTINTLKKYGITVTELPDGYEVPGNQEYVPCEDVIEGDYSQAAFFLVAGAIKSPVTVGGLTPDSAQGDKEILSVLKQCGAKVEEQNGSVTVSPAPLKPFSVSVEDIPDLVPILTVLATFCDGVSHITGAARLRMKESDRLEAIADCINKLGGKVEVFPDALTITGVPSLHGGTVDSFNDHRIAMSTAIAALRCTDAVSLSRAECVEKSYAAFYQDYQSLGGIVDGI